MSSSVYEQVAREAGALSREEQLLLIARLAEHLSSLPSRQLRKGRPRWEDFGGKALSPLCGEDAQQWVTRTRQESDQHRGTV